MKRYTAGVAISILALSHLNASQSVNLSDITVEDSAIRTDITDLYGEDLKSADLAEALTKATPSISIQRRSGIANDIILRGQRKDNINIIVDGGKIYGACPNRMDPPTSHIITSNIKNVEIIEGPYDVEDFGTLSGAVKITTKQPSKDLHGDINVNVGSWGYHKASISVSGGEKRVKILLGASTEESNQYKDGDGKTLAQQLQSQTNNPAYNYKPTAFDRKAYSKKSFMSKIYINVTENQLLELSYTGNRSNNILYPSTPMDAIYDDSDLYNVKYIMKDLGKYSDKLKFEYYNSRVSHPMTTQYRVMSQKTAGTVANVMSSRIYGTKIKNDTHTNNIKISYGAETSQRDWSGRYYKQYTTPNPVALNQSIPNVTTKNIGFFTKGKRNFGRLETNVGVRYDYTQIDANNIDPDRNYYDFTGYILTYYKINNEIKTFVGVGKAIRVPDAKELHDRAKDITGKTEGKLIGNPNLHETKNYETDLGIEGVYDNATFKAKVFYSILKDFILYNATQKEYQNADAKLYGFEISGSYFATDNLYFDYGIAYQIGKKEHPLAGQSDKDMPSITPLKTNIALNYEYKESLKLKAELIASNRWSNYDADNGEQEIAGWSVVNLKASKKFKEAFTLTLGVDNLFNRTYAVSNTYKDLTLVSGSAGDVMLLNEPGRYLYTNLKYSF